MDNIKVINLSNNYSSSNKNKKLSKKQIYKEILSSSDKVKEIINKRKKTRRFDYLNTIPLKEKSASHQQQQPYQHIESISNNNFIPIKPPPIIKPSPITAPIFKYKSKSKPNPKPKPISENTHPPKTIDTYFKPKSNIYPTCTLTKNINHTYTHPHFKRHRTPSPKNITSSCFTKKFDKVKLVKIIKIMYLLQNNDETIKLHKIIRKLNRFQIIQILFAFRLLNKNSNAPIDLLKNSLFNYITGNVKIIRNT